ncbi:uncharacterized protein LOC126775305 [Nymphalis io]|uniref:uncharacterized protein LOC126775305 n=1 Tax=Inachis io TaxID=171585 RepID=UPI0021678D89|nr:uncharacterized protein LOC126775305 [Nymphalis io]XP_050353100.1 uncharacterized protein LOC126775305 [Nymphalis io]
MAAPIFDRVPLSKALGFSIRDNFGKSVKDSRRGSNNLETYNEMLKTSTEFIGLEDDDNIGSDLARLKRIADRRRPVRLQSSVGRRRARSQELRRRKLNSQSLRSHRDHSRRSSSENMNIVI